MPFFYVFENKDWYLYICMYVCMYMYMYIYIYIRKRRRAGCLCKTERINLSKWIFLFTESRGGFRSTMIWLPSEKVADAVSSVLAIYDVRSSGVSTPCYRFALRFAFPFHSIDYVRYKFLLFFPLLFPIRTLAVLQERVALLEIEERHQGL